MSKDKVSKNSVNRSTEYHDLIDRLYGADKIFKYIFEVLCFAAYVGLHGGSRKKIKSKDEPVSLQYFVNNELDRHIWSINLFDGNDVALLKDSTQCLEVFEEYANGGLEIIDNKLKDHPEDLTGIDTLTAMIATVQANFAGKKSTASKTKIKF